jgi:hypothetical protein
MSGGEKLFLPPLFDTADKYHPNVTISGVSVAVASSGYDTNDSNHIDVLENKILKPTPMKTAATHQILTLHNLFGKKCRLLWTSPNLHPLVICRRCFIRRSHPPISRSIGCIHPQTK